MPVTTELRDKIQLLVVENRLGRAELSLFGGQVLGWIPSDGQGYDRLWVSPDSHWDMRRPVRGGIPVCWPWFGQHIDPSLPAHGFVRSQGWQLLETTELNDCTEVRLQPAHTVGRGLDTESELTLTLRLGIELTLILTTRNTGNRMIPLGCALHSYFRVSDIGDISLDGLFGTYSDKTRDWAHLQTPSPYRFSEETDRIHLLAAPEVVVNDPAAPGNTRIRSAGHDSIVVWNPWLQRAGELGDMAAGDHRQMLCVETALTQDFQLLPGQVHHLVQTIDVQRGKPD